MKLISKGLMYKDACTCNICTRSRMVMRIKNKLKNEEEKRFLEFAVNYFYNSGDEADLYKENCENLERFIKNKNLWDEFSKWRMDNNKF